jgi:hypothetical protein
MEIKKGVQFYWMSCFCEITRVGADGSWADIQVESAVGGNKWTKRQCLPLPEEVLFLTKGT